ncbi:MAG: hypothetical protein KDB07_12235, partial [Planctomycetes bacterium]|nr:hypothetical protein [Planctomycetota bacterium]
GPLDDKGFEPLLRGEIADKAVLKSLSIVDAPKLTMASFVWLTQRQFVNLNQLTIAYCPGLTAPPRSYLEKNGIDGKRLPPTQPSTLKHLDLRENAGLSDESLADIYVYYPALESLDIGNRVPPARPVDILTPYAAKLSRTLRDDRAGYTYTLILPVLPSVCVDWYSEEAIRANDVEGRRKLLRADILNEQGVTLLELGSGTPTIWSMRRPHNMEFKVTSKVRLQGTLRVRLYSLEDKEFTDVFSIGVDE